MKFCFVCVLLLCPALAHAQDRPSMKLALTTMAVGQGLDLVTTVQALKRGAVESNPIYGPRPSTTKLLVGSLPMVGVGWLLTKLAPQHPKIAQGTAYVIGGVGAGLAIHNYRQGRR